MLEELEKNKSYFISEITDDLLAFLDDNDIIVHNTDKEIKSSLKKLDIQKIILDKVYRDNFLCLKIKIADNDFLESINNGELFAYIDINVNYTISKIQDKINKLNQKLDELDFTEDEKQTYDVYLETPNSYERIPMFVYKNKVYL